MSCVREYSVADYLECKQTMKERIDAIDQMITATIMLTANTISGASGNISSYELDDGQVRIKTTYRSVEDITNAVTALRRIKFMFLNQLRWRASVLQDKRTFK